MTASTLMKGVAPHGAGYRVRMLFGTDRIQATFATVEEANRTAVQWEHLRALGLRPELTAASPTVKRDATTLRDRKKISGRKRKLRPRGLEWWERCLRPWTDGPLGDLPPAALSKRLVEEWYVARAQVAPKTATDELGGLKAVVRAYPGYDTSILSIEPVPHQPRTRRALTLDQLDFLVQFAPDYGQRLLAFKGTVGMRIEEHFTLVPARVDVHGRTVFVPAHLCKEGRDKTIPLTRDEAHLLAQQMLARPAGATTVFCKRQGGRFDYPTFHRYVWSKAVSRADVAHRELHGTAPDADSPYRWRLTDPDGAPLDAWDTLEPHDLRSTAATLMRDAGMAREDVAARIGHADSGKLLDRLYDQGDRGERARRRLDAVAPDGLRAALAGAGR